MLGGGGKWVPWGCLEQWLALFRSGVNASGVICFLMAAGPRISKSSSTLTKSRC